MPNTVRLHRVLAMKREKVYRAFIEPDPMVPTWQPGHFQAAPLWQPVGRSGLTVLSNVRCRQLRCVAALGRKCEFATKPVNCRSEQEPDLSSGCFGRTWGSAAVGQLQPCDEAADSSHSIVLSLRSGRSR
jgi:hypothetical protein